jgi:hypothetical protein
VVTERTFAEALGVSVGDKIMLNGQSFTVAGIAVSAAVAPYPNTCYSGCGLTGFLDSYGIGAKQIALVWTGLVTAQVLSALPGAIAGIPLGIFLFQAVSRHQVSRQPPRPASERCRRLSARGDIPVVSLG